MEVYHSRMVAFGLHTLTIDGHDIGELVKAMEEAQATKGLPTALVCKTYKGRGFPNIEDLENWHGKALGSESARVLKHLQSQLSNPDVKCVAHPPLSKVADVSLANITLSSPPAYKEGEAVATRLSYGIALKKIADSNNRCPFPLHSLGT